MMGLVQCVQALAATLDDLNLVSRTNERKLFFDLTCRNECTHMTDYFKLKKC